MADVIWPLQLPQDQAYGFSETPAGILATWAPGEWQKPLRRKRVSGLAVTTAYTFTMNDVQMQFFRSWWENNLASGANDILFADKAVNAQVRLTPTGAYEAASVSYNGWTVTIPVRRELVT